MFTYAYRYYILIDIYAQKVWKVIHYNVNSSDKD